MQKRNQVKTFSFLPNTVNASMQQHQLILACSFSSRKRQSKKLTPEEWTESWGRIRVFIIPEIFFHWLLSSPPVFSFVYLLSCNPRNCWFLFVCFIFIKGFPTWMQCFTWRYLSNWIKFLRNTTLPRSKLEWQKYDCSISPFSTLLCAE